MPNKHLAYHPRFLLNLKVTIAAPFAANATKVISYSPVKGIKTDMVLLATIDGNSGVIAIGASCLEDGRLSVVYRNNGVLGAKPNLTLTVVGL